MWRRLKNFLALGSSNLRIAQTGRGSTSPIPDDWKTWIWHNVSRGCSKDGIFKILHDHGFDYEAIKNELNCEPSVPLHQIENPLMAAESGSSPQSQESSQSPRPTNQIFIPNATKFNSHSLVLYTLENFLNAEECQRTLEVTRRGLRPSTITKEDEPDKDFRTSKTCDLALLNEPFVKELDRRICSIMGIDSTYSEGIQAQLYDVGQEFKPHTDYFEPNSAEFERFAKELDQRTWTFMVYLNDVHKGGGTRFLKLGKTFYPREGTALIWNNLYPSGEPNPDTLHHAMPVEQGYKAVITKWFRAKGKGKMFTKEANEYIPNYTCSGIKKLRIPSGLYQRLMNFYEQNKGRARIEIVRDYIENPDGAGSELIELSNPLKAEIHGQLRLICEEWCGADLEPTYVYGIRKYKSKTILKPHRDRIETHIIGAMLVVTQNVNEEWPLEIEDNYYRRHEIVVAPGEMILYEGGRLKHGRPKPLNGDYFCNVFVHYRPRNYSATSV